MKGFLQKKVVDHQQQLKKNFLDLQNLDFVPSFESRLKLHNLKCDEMWEEHFGTKLIENFPRFKLDCFGDEKFKNKLLVSTQDDDDDDEKSSHASVRYHKFNANADK